MAVSSDPLMVPSCLPVQNEPALTLRRAFSCRIRMKQGGSAVYSRWRDGEPPCVCPRATDAGGAEWQILTSLTRYNMICV